MGHAQCAEVTAHVPMQVDIESASKPREGRQGRSKGRSLSISGLARSRQLSKGDCRKGVKRPSLLLLPVKKRCRRRASPGLRRATARSIRSMSGVASNSPPEPKTSLYCGSSLYMGSSCSRFRPAKANISRRTCGKRKKVGPVSNLKTAPLDCRGSAACHGTPLDDGDLSSGFCQ